MLHRPPIQPLAPFVESLWCFDDTAERGAPRASRERALPTGRMRGRIGHAEIAIGDRVVMLSDEFPEGDPFGHEWLIGHALEEVSPDEMQRR